MSDSPNVMNEAKERVAEKVHEAKDTVISAGQKIKAQAEKDTKFSKLYTDPKMVHQGGPPVTADKADEKLTGHQGQ